MRVEPMNYGRALRGAGRNVRAAERVARPQSRTKPERSRFSGHRRCIGPARDGPRWQRANDVARLRVPRRAARRRLAGYRIDRAAKRVAEHPVGLDTRSGSIGCSAGPIFP